MELIDREKLKIALCNICRPFDGLCAKGTCTAINVINQVPTTDVEPIRHGEWIDAYPNIEPNPMFMYGICSVCGFEQSISNKLNYCPNCGAKMDGERRSG